MTDALRLVDLPSEILILIFDYCHAFDLVRLSEVCTRFNDLICCETLWLRKSKLPLVTNQTSKNFRKRCKSLLCLRTRWQICHNWSEGKFKKKALVHHEKLMPWVQLSDDILWWCGGDKLYGFSRKDDFEEIYRLENIPSDFVRFVVRDSRIISGHRDGSVQFRSAQGGNELRTIRNAHTHAVHAVDQVSGTLIAGSSTGVLKFWDEMFHNPCAVKELHDRIWSLSGNQFAQKVAVGCSGRQMDRYPLRIFDLETCEELFPLSYTYRRGAGILDMIWDNPYTLLTCGYDTYVRKWDFRAGKCVAQWPDPTDATTYCLATDYHNTIVTGTQFNCKAVLWDQRQTNFVQLYFMNLNRLSSPIYSISFDNCHLYGATDQSLVDLDFSGKYNQSNNYRHLLNYNWSQEEQDNFLRSYYAK